MFVLRVWFLFLATLLVSPAVRGETGWSAAESLASPHPEPRVIVNVLSISGPHSRVRVQRAARLGWSRIIRCYKAIDRRAKGLVGLEFRVNAKGRVTRVRRTRSTLRNPDLAACLADTLRGLAMPESSAESIATAEIRVAPGDPP